MSDTAAVDLTSSPPDESEIRALAERPGMGRLLQSQILLAQAVQSQEARPSREEAAQAFAELLNSNRDHALIDLAARLDDLERLMDGIHVTVARILAVDAAREVRDA